MNLSLYLTNGVSDQRRLRRKVQVDPQLLDIAAFGVQDGSIFIISRGVTIYLKKVDGDIYYNGGFFKSFYVENENPNSVHAELKLAQLPKGFDADK